MRWLTLILLSAACGSTVSEDLPDAAMVVRMDAAAATPDAAPDAAMMRDDAHETVRQDVAVFEDDAAAVNDDAAAPVFDDAAAPFADAAPALADAAPAEADAAVARFCGDGVLDAPEICDPGLSPCCNSTCDGPAPAGATCRPSAGECDLADTCDGASIQCPADAPQPDATACTGCALGVECAGCYAGACADSPYFCSDILARGQSTGSGIYTIRPAITASITPSTPVLPVFCDMTTEGGGWTMLYKKSRTNPGDAAALWSGAATSTANRALLNREMAPADYSSAIQTYAWSAFREARVEVVTGTITRQWIDFDVNGTTNIDWFGTTHHTSSSWTDLPTAPTFDNGSNQAFAIRGGRSFYINRDWGGCPNDRGWLMVTTVDPCYWETSSGDPADIIYSRRSTISLIPSPAETGYADSFVIFAR